MAANFQEVASQFVPFYYTTFDTNREGLASLYRDTSMLTYESASVMGVAAIVDKLKVCSCEYCHQHRDMGQLIVGHSLNLPAQLIHWLPTQANVDTLYRTSPFRTSSMRATPSTPCPASATAASSSRLPVLSSYVSPGPNPPAERRHGFGSF